MKITMTISDPLHIRAKDIARRDKTTLSALVNEGLTELLLRRKLAPGYSSAYSSPSAGNGARDE